MSSPLASLIDSSARCVKCSAVGVGTCKCWDATVKLKCKKCGKTKMVPPDEHDLPGTALVLMQCPECNPGDFDEPVYFDAAGKEIIFKG